MAEIVNPEGLSLFLTNMKDDFEDEGIDENLYRQCAQRLLPTILPAALHIASAKSIQVGYAQVKFALGLEERPMRDVAAELKVTVACISKGANEFIDENNLPRPTCMKSEDARTSYRETRKSQLTQP